MVIAALQHPQRVSRDVIELRFSSTAEARDDEADLPPPDRDNRMANASGQISPDVSNIQSRNSQ